MVTLLVGLILLGLASWVVQQIPMDATIKRIITVVIIVIAVLFLISFLFPGTLGTFGVRTL